MDCPDGVGRLLTLEDWYWNKLALITNVFANTTEQDIVDFCYEQAVIARDTEGWDLDTAFEATFSYYLYRLYRKHIQLRDGLANDTYKDVWAEDMWTPA